MPYYRRNICILSVTVFLASLSWYQIIPFLKRYMGEMGVHGQALEHWTGVVIAAQALGAIVCQPIWGKLADSVGRKPMILRAGFFLTVIYFGMGLCSNPWQLSILRFLNGALTGFIPGSYALIATNTPEDMAPRYVATAQSAVNVGIIAGPVSGKIISEAIGYRGTMFVGSLAVLLATLVVLIWVREPNKVKGGEKASLAHDLRTAASSPAQLSVLWAVMLSYMFGGAIYPYMDVYLDSIRHATPQWIAALCYSLPAVAFVLTARLWTGLGEQWGFQRSVVIGLVGGGIGAITLAFVGHLWLFAIVYFTAGLTLAALPPSFSGITITHVEESFRGRAFGIQQAAGTFGGFIAPIIASFIMAAYGMPGVFMFVGVVFLLGSVVFRALVARWPKTGNQT